MAFPMLAGTFAMTAYNLADTWFVARLGTQPLAAMGFSFPVVVLLAFIAGGIGSGVTTLASHALGRKDRDEASRLVSHGLLLTALVSVTLGLVGRATIYPCFRLLGADDATLPLIADYMGVSYLGAIFMAFPHVGNGILISLGDSQAASRFMLLGTLLNVVLDPILIFGLFGFPPMGIFGAALATVISQAVSTTWLLYLIGVRHRLLRLDRTGYQNITESWKAIMRFAVAQVISMALMPISSIVITGIVSRFGHEAVAGCGAAGRIEMFAFVVPMALGISLTPFISQNFGAARLDRIREAQTLSARFALLYGLFIALLFYTAANLIAWFFTDDPRVTAVIVQYVRIVSFGYGMMEVHRYSGFILNGLHQPASATTLNVIRIVVMLIPLSFLGAHLFGIRGVFIARLITDISVGGIGLYWVARILREVKPLPSSQGMDAAVEQLPIEL